MLPRHILSPMPAAPGHSPSLRKGHCSMRLSPVGTSGKWGCFGPLRARGAYLPQAGMWGTLPPMVAGPTPRTSAICQLVGAWRGWGGWGVQTYPISRPRTVLSGLCLSRYIRLGYSCLSSSFRTTLILEHPTPTLPAPAPPFFM